MCLAHWRRVPKPLQDRVWETWRAVRECRDCKGTGLVADYVGLEMKPIGVECESCGGTGRLELAKYREARNEALRVVMETT